MPHRVPFFESPLAGHQVNKPPELGDEKVTASGHILIYVGVTDRGQPDWVLKNPLSQSGGTAAAAAPTTFGEPFVKTINGVSVLMQNTSVGPQVVTANFGSEGWEVSICSDVASVSRPYS